MNEQDLQSFRERLEKMRSDLVEDSEETVHEMREENNLYPDPSDRATSETEHINLLRIRDRERKLMSKIDEAIDRLSNGSFGICEECGEDTVLVSVVTDYYRCTNCGTDTKQYVNGRIRYMQLTEEDKSWLRDNRG